MPANEQDRARPRAGGERASSINQILEDLGDAKLPLLPGGPPPMPEQLSPAQSAELCGSLVSLTYTRDDGRGCDASGA